MNYNLVMQTHIEFLNILNISSTSGSLLLHMIVLQFFVMWTINMTLHSIAVNYLLELNQ